MMYDLIIVGGAMAGLTSAIYAARKKLNTLVLTEKIGGQSLLTDNIENFPGFESISGEELIEKLKKQAERFGAGIKENIEVSAVEKEGDFFLVKTKGTGSYKAKAIVIATGKHPRWLGVPGEREYTGKGVSICSICDAPLFGGKDVAVIGSGNAGLEAAMDLTKYADKIYVLEFNGKVSGDRSTQEQLLKTGKVEFILQAEVQEIKGSRLVESLIYKNRQSGERKELKVEGIFVSIGQIASSQFVEGFLELNKQGEIVIDPKSNAASVPGVFAAGDVTDVKYKQCVIAAGEGAKAALSAYDYVSKLKIRNKE